MAGSRFTTTVFGEQFVMTSGNSMLPVLCAVSRGSLVPCRLFVVQHMVEVWILSGLMTLIVLEERPLCLIALIWLGEHIIADITKMQVLCVTLSAITLHLNNPGLVGVMVGLAIRPASVLTENPHSLIDR